ncbi:hypothetical protein HG531_002555 [Fusarium graminearum]|nr:hypothetical protein HG531_002555 [Fusarium graminearum]
MAAAPSRRVRSTWDAFENLFSGYAQCVMWPDVFDSSELGFERFIGRRNDVIFFFEGHKHLLDLERGLSEEVAAWSVCGSFDKSEELIFRNEKFSINLLQQREMSDELFRESGNGIGEVSDRRENVDGLVGTADRVSASTGAAHVRGASRSVGTSLTNGLRPAVRRALCRGRLG